MADSQTFEEVTIYSHQDLTIQGMGLVQPILGFSRTEARRVIIQIGKHAQYAQAVSVAFIPRGKRSERQYKETSRTTTVVLKGYGHPDVPHKFGPGPEPLFDEKWHTEFATFLESYRLNHGVEVLLDLRKHDSAPSHSTGPFSADASGKSATPVLEDDALSVWEGQLSVREHVTRERDAAIVRAKREHVLRSTGKLECEVCQFDFSAVYGIEFCEVHHLRPLSESADPVETKIHDLAVVCSNCHRVIHGRSPFYSLPELRALVDSRRARDS